MNETAHYYLGNVPLFCKPLWCDIQSDEFAENRHIFKTAAYRVIIQY